jgi:hypothetical protein
MDRELAAFLLALPPELISPQLSRSDKSFHSEAIRRRYPKVAHIPFEDDDAPHTDAASHNHQFGIEVAGYLLGRPRSFRLMRSPYVFSRLAFTLVSRRYAESGRWLAATALYLAQLESAVT